jgi:hypothetical protein
MVALQGGMAQVVGENLGKPLRSLGNSGRDFGPTVVVTAVTPVFRSRRSQPIESFLLGPHQTNAMSPVSHADDPQFMEMDALANALRQGDDVWIAAAAGDALEDSRLLRNYDGLPAVVGDFTGGTPGHAMVLAGYTDRPGGRYFLLHNSWGVDWGDRGYAWVHQETLRRNIWMAYTVDARVRDVTLSPYPVVRYNGKLVPGFQGFEPTPAPTLCFGGHAVRGFGDTRTGAEDDKKCR